MGEPGSRENDGVLRYGNVVLSPDGIEERDGARAVVSVPRGEIHDVHHAHGLLAERAILQLAVGALLLCAGLYFMRGTWLSVSRYGLHLPQTSLAFCVAPTVLGAWLLRSGLRRGPYLLVSTTRGGKRKLRLPTTLGPDFDLFMRRMRAELALGMLGVSHRAEPIDR
jgi:hypothetical protein